MIHKTIKEQIKEAMRAKDSIRLDTLRGLNALLLNEMIAAKLVAEFLPDDKVIPLIKRSIKQRKDSIEQFEKGGRKDLADKEKKELAILETYMPASMSKKDIETFARGRIEALKAGGAFDPKASGKIVGMLMKALAGKADGGDVKAVVDELIK